MPDASKLKPLDISQFVWQMRFVVLRTPKFEPKFFRIIGVQKTYLRKTCIFVKFCMTRLVYTSPKIISKLRIFRF